MSLHRFHRLPTTLVVTLLALLLGADPADAQRIEVIAPKSGSPSGAPSLHLSGFPAGRDVTLHYFRSAPDGQAPGYAASAVYRTDANGTVSPGAMPVSGDWTVSDPEAPFWAMRESVDAPLPPVGTILFRAEAGQERAEADYRIAPTRPLKVDELTEFPGAFLVRPAGADAPLPLIIVLGGSEGNDATGREVAPLLAAEGFAALGLPYYSPDRGRGQAIAGLPSIFSEIPVDRLEKVRRWAVRDPRVDADRIGLWGRSKGGEFALIAAANFPWLDAVAAIVPSDVVLEGFGSGAVERTGKPSFTLQGQPLPFVPSGPSGRDKVAKQAGRWANPNRAAAARIRTEAYDGLLLVAGGANDPVLDSSGAAQAIAERRAEAGKPTISLIFQNAGHYIGGSFLDPIEPSRGETMEGTGRARREVWSATVAMFRAAWPAKSDGEGAEGTRR